MLLVGVVTALLLILVAITAGAAAVCTAAAARGTLRAVGVGTDFVAAFLRTWGQHTAQKLAKQQC